MGREMGRLGVVLALTTTLFSVLTAAADEPRSDPMPISIGPGATQNIDTVVVAPGDHLWKISERHLEHQLTREPSESEVSPYWRRVIEANLGSLRSGNPNLIFPGEVVELPATESPGQP